MKLVFLRLRPASPQKIVCTKNLRLEPVFKKSKNRLWAIEITYNLFRQLSVRITNLSGTIYIFAFLYSIKILRRGSCEYAQYSVSTENHVEKLS